MDGQGLEALFQQRATLTAAQAELGLGALQTQVPYANAIDHASDLRRAGLKGRLDPASGGDGTIGGLDTGGAGAAGPRQGIPPHRQGRAAQCQFGLGPQALAGGEFDRSQPRPPG